MRAHRLRSQGSLLIIALWLMVLLNLFALGLGYRMSLELRLVGYQLRSAQARALALAGVQQALSVLDQDPTPTSDGLADPWSTNPDAFEQVPLGQGTFTVSYTLARPDAEPLIFYGLVDEDRKVNLNWIKTVQDSQTLARILARLPGMTEEVAETIVDFIDTDPYLVGQHGFEDYDSLDPPYEDKRGPLDALEELRLVKGMTPERYEQLLPYVTIYTQGQTVNVNTASAEVLKALDMPDPIIKRIIEVREGEDRTPGTEDDVIFTRFEDFKRYLSFGDVVQLSSAQIRPYLAFQSTVFRVEAEGRSVDGRIIHRIDAIVSRQANPLPAPPVGGAQAGQTHRRIIAWTEE